MLVVIDEGLGVEAERKQQKRDSHAPLS
jgi:hypothetical protein